ncbi:MAG: glycerol-3-phosphate ABC transporter ATP-binding protein [Ignavibacteria bacterium RIFOXYB2_FULL_36_7]|nr:MAG: glycerol-3-phosphate ABC transporter ATP-binding protein [Ignavibacteria bacterium RIFOXYB2_FULL_36_7]
MAEVILKNVTKVYEGGNIAAKDINIEVKDKEFVVLVGPSGCGKSTTLRMIAGLEEISSGDLFIDNKKVNDVSPKDRDIAMVFQNYALYPHMTVYENMAFGLKLRKFDKAEIKKRVSEAAKILDLEPYLERKPKALSGGQRQRVAVGRAIVRKPKVFLFDEPLSNLDAKLRVQMRTEISKLHQRLEATMIYVTHDQTEAMTMGDKIVIMKDGVVNQIDTPLNLYNYPTNKFVAGFIGSPSMNFIEGTLAKNGNLTFKSKKGNLNLSLNKNYENKLNSYANKTLWLGIRPEDIYDPNTVSPSANFTKVNVNLEVVEPMGNEIFLYFSIDGEQFVSRIPAREKPEAGTAKEILFDTSKLHFFDTDSEKTIV